MKAVVTRPASSARKARAFDVESIRAQFPILRERVHGKPLVYLDSAATTQKPQAVIDAIADYYATSNANVHRGVHTLSQRATEAYEGAREKVRAFLGAASTRETVFVRGTTEGLNLFTQSWGRTRLRPGDEIVVTAMEHHSNIVPWQILAAQTDTKLVVAPIDDRGDLVMPELEALIGERTRIVTIAHVSNALGTVNPVKRIASLAHAVGALLVVDGAQAAGHVPVDVQELDCDVYVISGHKMFAPTGIGVLWARESLLDAMPPWQGGGDMIKSVTFEKTIYNDLPHKFEAGTPDIAGAVGLGAAIDWMNETGREEAAEHEAELLEYGTRRLREIDEIRFVGTALHKVSVISFTLEGVHPHDVGTILDREGIAVRTGHHCAQPVMDRYGVPATTRASLSVYNRREDLDALALGLGRVVQLFTEGG
jgi:cysteine desulfurase/selenocysteine lyase